MDQLDLTFVDRAVERIGTGPEKVLEILQALQEHYRYLPADALERVCEMTEITPAAIAGVSTFYDQFRHRPSGRHMIRVCIGTACHVKGGQQVYDAFQRYLRIPEKDDTDPQRLFTVEKVACLGCCMLAPVIQIDDVTYGHLSGDQVPVVLRDFLEQEKTRTDRKGAPDHAQAVGEFGEIRICLDSSCVAAGSARVYEALKKAVRETAVRAVVKSVSCPGTSFLAPTVEVLSADGTSFRYARVLPDDARAIVLRHFKPKRIAAKVKNAISTMLDTVLTEETSHTVTRYSVDARDRPVADFLGRQVHIATEHCGDIDPIDLEEYLRNGGFQALLHCLSKLTPERVVEEIGRSGLRGRGGAGFPIVRKWSAVRAAEAENKYIVCNGDEGDPGAFMDRMLMESYPYRIIEGMAIAAYAVGARAGFLYIRAEYPLAIKRVTQAINTCRRRGLLGDKILDSDFSLNLKIVPGAGAFVCGEETALMASIEGRRGTPRLRPPYPAQSGLWGCPTLINNVETYAAVSWIVRNGLCQTRNRHQQGNKSLRPRRQGSQRRSD
jgi:NADH-quinone oxidoreductase subunit F